MAKRRVQTWTISEDDARKLGEWLNMSSKNNTVGTIIGVAAIGFVIYLIWPSSSNAATAQQANKPNPLSELLKALLSKKGAPSGGVPGGGGIAPLPMSGLDLQGALNNFINSAYGIGLTPVDAYQGSVASYDTAQLDNMTIPYQQTQQFDLSQFSQPVNAWDPSSVDQYYQSDSGSLDNYQIPSVDTSSYSSFDGGGYSLG